MFNIKRGREGWIISMGPASYGDGYGFTAPFPIFYNDEKINDMRILSALPEEEENSAGGGRARCDSLKFEERQLV